MMVVQPWPMTLVGHDSTQLAHRYKSWSFGRTIFSFNPRIVLVVQLQYCRDLPISLSVVIINNRLFYVQNIL